MNSDLTLDKVNGKGKRLASLLNNFSLKTVIKEATRVTENTCKVIDLLIFNDITKVKTNGVHDICIADQGGRYSYIFRIGVLRLLFWV